MYDIGATGVLCEPSFWNYNQIINAYGTALVSAGGVLYLGRGGGGALLGYKYFGLRVTLGLQGNSVIHRFRTITKLSVPMELHGYQLVVVGRVGGLLG
jgi:hypothetical protein